MTFAWLGLTTVAQLPLVGAPLDPALRHGRELLAAGQFRAAKEVFAAFLRTHPAAVQAEVGKGDAELGLREFESAEASYRAAVAQQPEFWQAHKNLVVVEAAMGRWEEFDRERTVLRLARERGAPGISTHESDVIDKFDISGERWIVRAYFEPVGRSEARYNFERFSPDGRVQAYLSLENAAAAAAALTPSDVRIGTAKEHGEANAPGSGALSLNWYTGTAHGKVRDYDNAEPTYERLRTDVTRWLLQHPEVAGLGPSHITKQKAAPGRAVPAVPATPTPIR